METIVFKVPVGTKAKLKRIHRNISELMREQAERLIQQAHTDSAFEKVRHLCGSAAMSRTASISKDYVKQYAKKSAR
jgi:aspartate oxidase